MDTFKSTSFWMGFSAAMLISLLIGGLVSAMLNKCPAFGPLLLISIGAALLGGFAAQQFAQARLQSAVQSVLPSVSAAPSAAPAPAGSLQERISQARERLSRSTLDDRIAQAAEQIRRLEARLAE
jgi:hypothetical protein